MKIHMNTECEKQTVALQSVIPADAMSIAAKLRTDLTKGPVLFAFRKADGTVKTTFGTTRTDIIPQSSKTAAILDDFAALAEEVVHAEYEEKATGPRLKERAQQLLDTMGAIETAAIQAAKVTTIPYFDLGALAWRSAKVDSIIYIAEA